MASAMNTLVQSPRTARATTPTRSNARLQRERAVASPYGLPTIAPGQTVGSAKPGGTTSAETGSVRQALASTGQPLSSESRAFFEPRFGHHFGAVRVHTGAAAAAAARSLSAHAFTLGSDIVFAPGRYAPDSQDGRRTLAHELTHVVQQSGQRGHGHLTVGPPNDAYEREADAVSQRIARNEPARPSALGAAGRLQRQCADCEQERAPGAGVPLEPLQDSELLAIGGQSTTAAPVAQSTLRTAAACIQRDLAVEPPNQAAARPVLTDAEIAAAIRFNQNRFQDPFTLATIRDVIGIARFPAVSDRALAEAIAYWQAQFNLTVDGQIGPATTATLVTELGAEALPELVSQVRQDNSVSVSTVGAVTRNVPAPAAHGLFRLDATFRTSLRNGWIVQVLNNTWNETLCGGGANPNVPTANYSEAWWVDGAGQVRLPTSTANPPTSSALPGFHDRWQRGLAAGTSGTFTMRSRLYTTLRLPAGFGIGTVPDAGALPSRLGAPAGDDVGLVVARRSESSSWNGCTGVPNFHTA